MSDADRLVSGAWDWPGQPGVRAVLAAAAAPASVAELAGEQLAVEGFRAGYRAAAGASHRHRVRIRPVARAFLVKFTAAVALVLAGGTAFAAETGSLPDRTQQGAHNLFSFLGVPAPGAGRGATPAVSGRDGTHPATPFPTHPTVGPGSSGSALLGLCLAWDADQKDPHSKTLPAESRKTLIEAAGGEAHIPAFCADLVAASVASAGTVVSPNPSHPGDGNSPSRPSNSPHR